jgi:hypothetical protein
MFVYFGKNFGKYYFRLQFAPLFFNQNKKVRIDEWSEKSSYVASSVPTLVGDVNGSFFELGEFKICKKTHARILVQIAHFHFC